MRVGEAIALDRDDVDLRERRLVIRHAKGGGRQLPLHPSTASELFSYASVRDQLSQREDVELLRLDRRHAADL